MKRNTMYTLQLNGDSSLGFSVNLNNEMRKNSTVS